MRLAASISALLLSVSLAPGAEPIGEGILGASAAELAKKLGPIDEKQTEYWVKSGSGLRAPVVRFAIYHPKKLGLLRVGFDDKGIARTIDFGGGARLEDIQPACDFVAGGWKSEPELFKVYPPNTTRFPVIQGLRIPGIQIWEYSRGQKTEIFPYQMPAGVAETGTIRLISACSGRQAYAVGEIRIEVNSRPSCKTFYIADADTFWAWTFDDLFTMYRDGWPPGLAPKKDDKAPVVKRPESMEDKARLHAMKIVASRRLAAAVVEVIRNPAADLAPAQRATQLLADRYDQLLSRQLKDVLPAVQKPVRERAAIIAAQLTDPALIDPLIAGLAGKSAIDGAAAALKSITGQDFGPNQPAWKQWVKENRNNLNAAYAARQTELAGDQVYVAVVNGSKQYHAYQSLTKAGACPDLTRASFGSGYRRILLKEARETGLRPCPKCNPVK